MEQFTIAGCFRPVCDNVSIVAVLMGKEILGETIFAAVSRSANGVEHWQSDTLPAAKVVARKPRDGDCLGALKRSIQLSQASSNEDRERWSISATFRDRTLQVVGRERRDKLNHIHWEVILKPAADGFAVAELISRGVATLLTWSEVAAKKVETAEETIRVQQRTIEIMTASKRSLEIELFSAFHHTLNYHRMRVQQQRSSSMKPERDTQVAATRRSHFSDDENNEEEDEGSQNFETYGDSMVMDNERIVNLHELSQPGHVGATDIENVSGHLALSRKRKQLKRAAETVSEQLSDADDRASKRLNSNRVDPPIASVEDSDAAANGGDVASAAAREHVTLSSASASATARADAPSPANFLETDLADEYDFE